MAANIPRPQAGDTRRRPDSTQRQVLPGVPTARGPGVTFQGLRSTAGAPCSDPSRTGVNTANGPPISTYVTSLVSASHPQIMGPPQSHA
ncbi:hypothetical protein FKP32DRAFT_1589621 [Trametes sanguinea]|nr:hypothetical protein FKP32DRAFT_1589621 [Trametes sanguinea]